MVCTLEGRSTELICDSAKALPPMICTVLPRSTLSRNPDSSVNAAGPTAVTPERITTRLNVRLRQARYSNSPIAPFPEIVKVPLE